MTDIRFIHANDGRVLTIEIAGTTYTPEQIRAALSSADARTAELGAEIARLKDELAGQLKSRASVVAVQHGATKRANGMEAEVAGLQEEVVKLWHALADLENYVLAAERAGLSLPRPASFGQWRRPEK